MGINSYCNINWNESIGLLEIILPAIGLVSTLSTETLLEAETL